MASDFITGVAQGMGFEYIRQFSKDPEIIVIGLVRKKRATDEFSDRKNLHIVQGDMTGYASLKQAAEYTAQVTSGALDYVIANAALISTWSAYLPIGKLDNEPENLEKDMLDLFKVNMVGAILALSSGFAFMDLAIKHQLYNATPYTISKVALEGLVMEFHAQYTSESVLFMATSPGMVDTGNGKDTTPAEQELAGEMIGKFMAHAPDFKGLNDIDVAVGMMLDVMYRTSLGRGDKGVSVSEFGNRRKWL